MRPRAKSREKTDRRSGPNCRIVCAALAHEWASGSAQTSVRMIVASVSEVNGVKANAQLCAQITSLAAGLLVPCLPRERHRALGDGRLQPDAGGLSLRPARPLRLRPAAE